MKGIEVLTEGKALQPYSAKRSCPKCGCALIESRYDQAHDVMVRKCPCGYVWREMPLDRKSKESK